MLNKDKWLPKLLNLHEIYFLVQFTNTYILIILLGKQNLLYHVLNTNINSSIVVVQK